MGKFAASLNIDRETNWVSNNTKLRPKVLYYATDANGVIIGTKIGPETSNNNDPTTWVRWNSVDYQPSGSGSAGVLVWNGSAYVLDTNVKSYVGPDDPGPAGLNVEAGNYIWFVQKKATIVSNIQTSIITKTTARINWDQDDEFDLFTIYRSQEYTKWADVQNDETIAVGRYIHYTDDHLYLCDTEHSVGNPKTFTSGNFTDLGLIASALVFSSVADTTNKTYDDVNLGNLKSYSYYVSTTLGNSESAGNTIFEVTTEASSLTVSSFILALTGISAYHKFSETSGTTAANTEGTGGRDLTLTNVNQLNKPGLETSEDNLSIETNASSSYDARSSYAPTITGSFSWGTLIRGTTQGGGKKFLDMRNYAQSLTETITLDSSGTSPFNGTRLYVRNNNGDTLVDVTSDSDIFLDNSIHLMVITYDGTTLKVYKDGVELTALSQAVDLSVFINMTGYTLGSNRTASGKFTGFYDEHFVLVGHTMTTTEMTDLLNLMQLAS